jgi:hypothetical protein
MPITILQISIGSNHSISNKVTTMTSTTIYTSEKVLPYVYRLDNPITGEFYIGYRKANKVPSHLDLPKYKTSSKNIFSIFEEFSFIIIAEFFNGSDAYDYEQKLIYDNWNDPLILNENCRHNGKQFRLSHHTEETKNKISKTRTGMKFTESHKINIGLSSKGRPGYWKDKNLSPTHIKSLIDNHKGMTGLTHTEETKNKISESHKGLTHTEETKNKMSISFTGEGNPNFGKTRSLESKQQSRESNIIMANLRREFASLNSIPYKSVTKNLPEFIIFIQNKTV